MSIAKLGKRGSSIEPTYPDKLLSCVGRKHEQAIAPRRQEHHNLVVIPALISEFQKNVIVRRGASGNQLQIDIIHAWDA
jgi:hypothetical protein